MKKNILNQDMSWVRVPARDMAIFTKNLGVMLASGLSITESMEIVSVQAKGKLKNILLSVAGTIQAGNTLSQALGRFPKDFSSFYINTVSAGEASGNLESNLKNIAEHLDKQRELVGKIKAAMLYPAIVLSISLFIGLGVAFFVFPKILPIFKGFDIELPLSTRILIAFADLVVAHGTALILGILGGILFMVWLFRQKFVKPFSHKLFLNIPIIGIMSRGKNITLTCRSIGMLLKSGINIDEAVRISATTVENYWYKKSLKRIAANIGRGEALSELFKEQEAFFPTMVVSMIRVGERSGKLEEELFSLADMYEADVDNATKVLSTAIEPLLLVLIGLLVGGLALSIITPIYKITGSVY